MTVEAISEGLKLAVSKGETLQQAMQSFYNTGYKKEDIESAARLLSLGVMQAIQPQTKTIPQQKPIPQKRFQLPQNQPILPKQLPFKPVQKISGYGQSLPQPQAPLPQKSLQKISGYGQPPKQKNPKMIMIILVIILLIIFGGAIGWILFFKENVVEFFNRLVG